MLPRRLKIVHVLPPTQACSSTVTMPNLRSFHYIDVYSIFTTISSLVLSAFMSFWLFLTHNHKPSLAWLVTRCVAVGIRFLHWKAQVIRRGANGSYSLGREQRRGHNENWPSCLHNWQKFPCQKMSRSPDGLWESSFFQTKQQP